ncbi:sulfurtransferase [Bacillus solitudinis]|uniref:sulfurtransferase n=1 Tax=Bacillus solitudinis TaxID=2014074 RepID=UPI000C246C64|nr:sulfurtransferase [Bacillus solitudinis]
MNSIVDIDWLGRNIDNQQVRIIDCRFSLGDPENGELRYEQAHIPGAVYLDLEKDLSGPVMEHGGRHPLPSIETLSVKLGQYGIDNKVTVVAYDDEGGPFASRLWWLLQYMGHDNVYVLNGGFSSWVEKNSNVTPVIPSFDKKIFKANICEELLATREMVLERTDTSILIDSREPARYAGEIEPIDRIAGHIPGAKNIFWKEVLMENGRWKAVENMQQFATFSPKDELIVYCGSGVTACPNILALKNLGFERVRLYSGSWSDWISYEDSEIECVKDK